MDLAVSSNFKSVYEAQGLQGIESFEPLEVIRYGTRKEGDFPCSPPRYFVIRVPWGGAKLDEVASGVTRLHPEEVKCDFCRVGVSGLKFERTIIDDTSWNGGDIFRPRGAPFMFMASQRFQAVAEKEEFTNLRLVIGKRMAFDEHRRGLSYINDDSPAVN